MDTNSEWLRTRWRLCRRRERSVGCAEENFSSPEACSLLLISIPDGQHKQRVCAFVYSVNFVCGKNFVRDISARIRAICVLLRSHPGGKRERSADAEY